jgi:predicted metalloprotease with PDZ domain
MTARREVALLLISSLLVGLLFGTHLGPVHASDDMPSSSTSPELSYVMTINNTDAQNHRAHILMTLSNLDTDILTLTFHTYHGRYPIPILNLDATNEKAEELSVEYTESNNRFWKILSHNAREVFVEYAVEFSVIRGGVEHLGYLGRDFAVSMAEWTFLVPHQRSVHGVEIQFKLPTGWKSYTPWNKVSQDTYYSDSLESFSMSVYALGDFSIFTRKIGETNASIAVYNQWTRETQERIAQSALKIFEYQSNLFGKSITDRYLAVFSPFADDGMQIWGGEYSYSQGLSVRTPLDERGFIEAMQWFSHQVFHTWNAWSPGGMASQSDEEQWFIEGIDVYYESKVLLDLGILTEHTVLKDLYREYLSQYVGTKYDVPLTEAPKHWNLEMSGQDAQRYSFIIYQKGALVSLMLDIQIRIATNGEKTIDQLMSYMYSRYGGKKGQFSNNDVMGALRFLTGRDFSVLFNQYVYGTQRLPLDQSFTTTNLTKDTAVWRIGDTVTLAATLADLRNEPIPNATIVFYVNSQHIATNVTNSEGMARANYNANMTGDFTVRAFYPGTKNYTRLQSNDLTTITVESVENATPATATTPTTPTILVNQTYLLIAVGLVLAIIVLGPVFRALKRKENS